LIRGHDVDFRCHKIYSYDGLYKVIGYDLEVGQDGHKVYTFDLERRKDQPPLGCSTGNVCPQIYTTSLDFKSMLLILVLE